LEEIMSAFRYPHPTNEVAARLVAGMVALLGGSILAFDLPWLLPLLLYGFAARVAAGPTFSPMAQLATRVLLPALGNPRRPTAGPPKRFAQGIGLVVSGAALVSWLVLGQIGIGRGLLGILVLFATLEAALGFCAGCMAFRQLMRWGWIPAETCERCNNLTFPARNAA
jgi:hypothetical protein